MAYIVLENIRSAYNVGNIIRTADAFGFDVIISGYTPSPFTDEKVRKTSLGAENSIGIIESWDTKKTLTDLLEKGVLVFCAEITQTSVDLKDYILQNSNFLRGKEIAIIFGNEVEGVLEESLELSHKILHLPMRGNKESLNVGQAAAVFMWEFMKLNG